MLNKNVLTQAQMLVVLRTIAPQDLAAMKAWIDVHGDEQQGKTLMESLPSLPIGDAWFWSPGWPTVDGIFKRVHVLPIETFDSGKSPDPGVKPIVPKNLADVDLNALKGQMAATIEKAKADDPRELKKQIKALELQVAGKAITAVAVHLEKQKPALTDADRALLKDLGERLSTSVDAISDRADVMLNSIAERARAAIADTVSEWLKEVGARRREFDRLLELKGFQKILSKLATVQPPAATPDFRHPVVTRASSNGRSSAATRPTETRAPRVPVRSGVAADASLGKGERKVLTAVAQYDDGVTREQLTILTAYKRSSRDTYLQRLRQAGHIDERGDRIVATDAGLKALGDFDPLPIGDELRAHWLRTLPEGERKVLEVLVRHHPRFVDRDAIDEATGYKRSSRDTYLQRLGARQIIESERGQVKASDQLFG